jgi:hypothetical protein
MDSASLTTREWPHENSKAGEVDVNKAFTFGGAFLVGVDVTLSLDKLNDAINACKNQKQ